MRRSFAILLVLICMCLSLSAQQQKSPSTPEERERFVNIVHKLEQSPLDKSLQSDKEWAFRWLVEAPDVHVTICTAPLGDYFKQKPKYKYDGEILMLYTLSMGAFAIEQPDKANDQIAQYVAGVTGALNAYNAILKEKPNVKSKALDDLLDKQAHGQLVEFVQAAATKGCDKQQTSAGHRLSQDRFFAAG